MQLRITKPLEERRVDQYDKLKGELYIFITQTADFPEWKQVNYSDSYSMLILKALTTPLTSEDAAQKLHIEAVRAWKGRLIAERDRVRFEISAASDQPGVMLAYDSFLYESIPLPA